MKKLLLAAAFAAFISTPVLAEDIGNGLDLSANVALSSDYVWRGVTQTGGDPAVSGGFDLAYDFGLYAGTWASNVTGGSEFDLYGGVSNEMFKSGISYDVGVIKYIYPSQGAGNFYEVYGGLSADVGPLTPSATVWVDPDNDTEYYDATVDFALVDNLGLSAHYGKYDGDAYDWSLGASTSLLSLDWSVVYADHEDAGDRWVFSASKSF